ncbi:MAG: hypothetical protein HOJ18_04620 [Rhodospirillaceae bacterium]|nr:hypothetical protein [Rhodospirillaceae bacterium]
MIKKITFLILASIAFAGSGYLILSYISKTAVETKLAELKMNIEKNIPKSDFMFGEVSTDVLANTAQVSDLALNINDKTLATANLLVILGNELTLERAVITGIEGSIKNRPLGLNFSVKNVLLTDVNTQSINKFIEELDADPVAAFEALNDVSIGELGFNGVSFTADVEGEEIFKLTGEAQLSGVQNGAIETLKMSGSVKDKYGEFFGNTIDSSLNSISITGLDLGNLLTAIAMEDEQLLIAQLQNGFGISAVSIEGLTANIDDEVKTNLANATIEIADNVINTFSLNDFNFINKNEEISINIGTAQFRGLDLDFDYFSEMALIENTARFYGLTDGSFNNLSYVIEGEEFEIGEFRLADVTFEDAILVRGILALHRIKLPISLISEMDRSIARAIESFTNSESLTLSISNSIDLNIESGTYDTDLNFGIEGFAEVRLNAALAGLDVAQIRKASKANNTSEVMKILGVVSEKLSISSFSLEYNDDQLAEALLSETPDVGQLVGMSEMQIDMMLRQYTEQAEQLKASIKAFLEGKNGFKFSMSAQPPVRIMDMQKLFETGDMTKSIIFGFEGS